MPKKGSRLVDLVLAPQVDLAATLYWRDISILKTEPKTEVGPCKCEMLTYVSNYETHRQLAGFRHCHRYVNFDLCQYL